MGATVAGAGWFGESRSGTACFGALDTEVVAFDELAGGFDGSGHGANGALRGAAEAIGFKRQSEEGLPDGEAKQHGNRAAKPGAAGDHHSSSDHNTTRKPVG